MLSQKRSAGAAIAILSIAALAGCSGDAVPKGYSSQGTVNGFSLLASPDAAHQRLNVILRNGSGDVLCESNGPLPLSDGQAAPALCDGTAGETYAYVLPVRSTDSAMVRLCDAKSGSPVAPQTLAYSWSSGIDFLVVVQETAASQGGVTRCE